MEKRYRYLRIISTIYKVLGVLAIGWIALSAFSDVASRSTQDSLTTLLIGGVVSLSLFAMGQICDLFIAMEENTRATCHLLVKILKTQPGENHQEENVIVPLLKTPQQ